MVTHRIVAYLISLAVGYWVLTLADKEKNNTKKIGQVIGWIIIVVSLIGPLCLAGSALRCHSNPAECYSSANCPWGDRHSMMGGPGMMKGWECPGHGRDMMKGSGMMDDKSADESKEKSK
ncbi:MAG TPA: hypothetical protein VMV05_09020 [bacterium]|nr:hypothetical protein [bacterium]